MKHNLLFVALMGVAVLAWGQGTTKSVLFVGNSYTEVNNLPSLVQSVARSVGDDIEYQSHTPGGCTFQQHCTNNSMTLIQSGAWDVVVLQEQSQLPSFPDGQVATECLPYAAQLVSAVYAANDCTEPMFYMTWGRKNGDRSNAAAFPPLGTYEGMDSLLYLRYMMMAHNNDASVCPVGRVWHYLRDNHPDIELYSADESHPSMAGSYAAACAFYAMIFHKDPTAITYNPGIKDEHASIIRSVAATVVLGQMDSWTRPLPVADFEVVDSCFIVNHSQHATSYLWDFGGGITSERENPLDDLNLMGYEGNATLIVKRHCMSDTVTKYVVIDGSGIDNTANSHSSIVISNPVKGSFTVGCEGKVELYDTHGRRVVVAEGGNPINVEALPAGLYLLRVQGRSYKVIVA